MFHYIAAALLVATPVIAMAQDAAPAAAAAEVIAVDLKPKMVLWDKNGARIGPVISIASGREGGVDSVTVIQGEGSARVAGATLSLAEGKLVTSLTKREIGRR